MMITAFTPFRSFAQTLFSLSLLRALASGRYVINIIIISPTFSTFSLFSSLPSNILSNILPRLCLFCPEYQWADLRSNAVEYPLARPHSWRVARRALSYNLNIAMRISSFCVPLGLPLSALLFAFHSS